MKRIFILAAISSIYFFNHANAQNLELLKLAFNQVSLSERKSIQSELKAYGSMSSANGYQGAIDGQWGIGTASALVEAYAPTVFLWGTMNEQQFIEFILEPYEFWGEGGCEEAC